jgi:hypothetical protein
MKLELRRISFLLLKLRQIAPGAEEVQGSDQSESSLLVALGRGNPPQSFFSVFKGHPASTARFACK